MKNLADMGVLRALLAKHGVAASKAMGQNFLVEEGVCPQMARAACPPAEGPWGALEIGPGVGVLTCALAEMAQKVAAIELDRRLLPVLAETLEDCGNVKIIEGDAMKLDLRAVLAEEFSGLKVAVCANLPYYITSPLVMRLLEERLPLSSITVMVQKEAALRLCAVPGTRACGAVSAAVRWYAEPEILFEVGRESFMPPPKVDSAVIRLAVRETPGVPGCEEQKFFRVVKAAFCQRRKMVTNALCAGLGISKEEIAAALEKTGCKPTARAEELTMEQLGALANALFK